MYLSSTFSIIQKQIISQIQITFILPFLILPSHFNQFSSTIIASASPVHPDLLIGLTLTLPQFESPGFNRLFTPFVITSPYHSQRFLFQFQFLLLVLKRHICHFQKDLLHFVVESGTDFIVRDLVMSLRLLIPVNELDLLPIHLSHLQLLLFRLQLLQCHIRRVFAPLLGLNRQHFPLLLS